VGPFQPFFLEKKRWRKKRCPKENDLEENILIRSRPFLFGSLHFSFWKEKGRIT
jgi:hypothetical protein